MPSIDLARLRKQAHRLADFYFVPDDFTRNLSTTLDSYVNHTIRQRRPASAGGNLRTHRTPSVVIKQIEQEIAPLASEGKNADASLALADRLWDESWLETRRLAAFVLGRMPPDEGPLVARLTAWISQVRDAALRAQLLDASLHRMRKEAPDMFLQMLAEWVRPERARLWPDAVAAALSAVRDPDFPNIPALMQAMEPVVRDAPAALQLPLQELILALHRASPTETGFYVQKAIGASQDPQAALTYRRMLPSLPEELRDELRGIVRSRSLPGP